MLAITTGMREGELFGLRWSDVNLTTRSVHLVRRRKTKSSRRHILLPRIAADSLAEHRTRQAADRALAGSNWEANDLVFPNTVGRPINPSNLLIRKSTVSRQAAAPGGAQRSRVQAVS